MTLLEYLPICQVCLEISGDVGILATMGEWENVLALIEAQLTAKGISPAEASRKATGHPYLLYSLRKGVNPKYDTLKALCDALDLEFYIGPPREEVDWEMEEYPFSQDEKETLLEAIEKTRKSWKQLEQELEAVERESSSGTPAPAVPVEIVRALGLRYDCTLQDAVAAISGLEEYVDIKYFTDDDDVISVKRRALPTWSAPDRMFFLDADVLNLGSLDWSVPKWHLLILDCSQDTPGHGELFAVLFDHPSDFVIGRVYEADDKWVVTNSRPEQELRTLGEYDFLIGQVVWHGPENSSDIRDEYSQRGEHVHLSHAQWRAHWENILATKRKQESPAARQRVGSKS